MQCIYYMIPCTIIAAQVADCWPIFGSSWKPLEMVALKNCCEMVGTDGSLFRSIFEQNSEQLMAGLLFSLFLASGSLVNGTARRTFL